MQHIKIKKYFVMAMKSNRLVALTLEDKKQGKSRLGLILFL